MIPVEVVQKWQYPWPRPSPDPDGISVMVLKLICSELDFDELRAVATASGTAVSGKVVEPSWAWARAWTGGKTSADLFVFLVACAPHRHLVPLLARVLIAVAHLQRMQ